MYRHGLNALQVDIESAEDEHGCELPQLGFLSVLEVGRNLVAMFEETFLEATQDLNCDLDLANPFLDLVLEQLLRLEERSRLFEKDRDVIFLEYVYCSTGNT